MEADRLAELEKIAREANLGEAWNITGDENDYVVDPETPGEGNVVCAIPDEGMDASRELWPARAQHIAAFDPPTALALLSDLTAMREENERLEKALRYQEARSDRIGTHGVGCETWGPQHYECALRELEVARQALGTSHGS